MEKKITIGNVCFIQDPCHNNVLLLERNKDPLKGLWTGVGGKTEFHEDIKASCLREIGEETGLEVRDLQLKGIVKTIVLGKDSSWILFVYSATALHTDVKACDEGTLRWVPKQQIQSCNLIGFIRPLFPHILSPDGFFEGTIVHDVQGNSVEERLSVPSEKQSFSEGKVVCGFPI